MQVGSGFGGMGDKFDSIFPPSNIDNIIVVSGFMLVVRYADENWDESQDDKTKKIFWSNYPTVTVDCASSLCSLPSSLYASL